MKNLQRFFTLFMAFAVLAASLGVGVVEHQCKVKGKSVSYFLTEKSSCHSCTYESKNTSKAQIKRQKCCKDSYSFKKIEVATSKILAVDFSIPLAFSPTKFLKMLSCNDLENKNSSLQYISFSSLLHGRCLLSFIQSFLI